MKGVRIGGVVTAVGLLVSVVLLVPPAPGAAPGGVIKVPELSYRTGAYGASGGVIASGREDYFALVNAQGGVEGMKIEWRECEDGYDTARGVECYERNKQDMSLVFPESTGITYALAERAARDKIPLVTTGYGISAATDGKTFPWIFPVLGNYWSQASAFVNYLSAREHGSVKGLRIALLHLDIPYGREPVPMFQALAQKYGFEFRNFPLPAPGLEQTAAWVEMARRYRANYVIQWNFGQSCTVPFTAMREVNFPVDHFLGVWWCGSEEDVRPAGDLAKDYVVSNFTGVGRNFPVIQQILSKVYKAGKGNLDEAKVGSVYYNRGVIQGIVYVEVARAALKQFGPPINGQKMRWGLEHLTINDERIEALGAKGFMPPIKLTAEDHGGVSGAYFQWWNGKEWVRIPGFWQPDADVVWDLVRAGALQWKQTH